MQKESHLLLAYYHFTPLAHPQEEIQRHLDFFEGKPATGRIYFSETGVNGQLSAEVETAEKYIDWLHRQKPFEDVVFKQQRYWEQAFPRMTVKYRRQLVAIDREVDLSQRALTLSPREWRAALESEEGYLLLDVRNDYEWQIGHFQGATLPPCSSFRQFPAFSEQLLADHDPKETKVLMYCTGGIRCELFSAFLRQEGWEQLFQLEGGILNYGQEEGEAHWKGRLFVFDDRLSISLTGASLAERIAHCHHCGNPADLYANCANMDCNALFISCESCLPLHQGCCTSFCLEGERLRPYQAGHPYKPFRRKHLIG